MVYLPTESSDLFWLHDLPLLALELIHFVF